jgi:hypothetical protein
MILYSYCVLIVFSHHWELLKLVLVDEPLFWDGSMTRTICIVWNSVLRLVICLWTSCMPFHVLKYLLSYTCLIYAKMYVYECLECVVNVFLLICTVWKNQKFWFCWQNQTIWFWQTKYMILFRLIVVNLLSCVSHITCSHEQLLHLSDA